MTYFLPQHLKKCESFAEIEREIQSVSKASSAVQVCACSERPWVAGFSLLCEHMQQICGLSCFSPSLAHAKITVKPILHTKLLKGSS